jgi:hypothetical protein
MLAGDVADPRKPKPSNLAADENTILHFASGIHRIETEEF